MRRSFLFICFILIYGLLRAAEIAVIFPELSVPKGEQRFARALAGHVERWYREAGVDVDLLSDTQWLSAGKQKLVVLVDCYAPPQRVIDAVKTRLDTGIKFVVCYSASPALAALFGLAPEGYRQSKEGRWASMQMNAAAPAGSPSTILQSSSNICAMRPLTKTVVPMSYWCDRKGAQTDVAWWRTAKKSYWMTHVLSGDGDEEGKQQLLLAIAAESLPRVWGQATRTVILPTQQLLKAGTLQERIRALPKNSPRRQALDKLYLQVLKQADSVAKRLNDNSASAYSAACDWRDMVARVYGMTYWGRTNEVCGVWDHSGQGLFPGNWEKTAKLLAASGITDVYVNVAGGGFARYPSTVLPRVSTVSQDCLKEAVTACHNNKLRVHAWILSFSCEMTPAATIASYQKKQWTLQEANGKETTWLDPTAPAVRAHLLSIVKEIATQSAVDGIHLDFIRYPSLQQTLGPRVRARFERALGKGPLASWPACVTDAKGSSREAFLKWRADQITEAVSQCRTWLNSQRSRMQLSVAVYGKYPACIASVGQNWLSWLRMGFVDYALPMNYTEDLTKLRDWLATQTADGRLARKIISGIGVTAAESRLSPVEVLKQVEVSRQNKCAGFALFDLDETLRKSILPVLSEGVTKR